MAAALSWTKSQEAWSGLWEERQINRDQERREGIYHRLAQPFPLPIMYQVWSLEPEPTVY
jgi:hypothetical protein